MFKLVGRNLTAYLPMTGGNVNKIGELKKGREGNLKKEKKKKVPILNKPQHCYRENPCEPSLNGILEAGKK